MKVPKILDDVRRAFVNPHWAIGVVDDYQSSDILCRTPENICWFSPSGKYDFYADCFITKYFGEPVIFFENWNAKSGVGVISYVTVADVKQNSENIDPYVHTALKGSTHFSYPFLFNYEQELYLIPENFQSNSISLYKAGKTPDAWTKVKTLIPGFQGIDPVIFQYNDFWWLLATKRSSNERTEDTDLYIWYSDNPLGEWTSHPANPVKYDRPIARGGGRPFVHEGILYRPVQDCSRTYGGELAIMKITTLTPEHFSEEVVKTLSGHSPYENAFHTFSSCGNVAVLDGNRAEYSLIMPIFFVKYVTNIFRNL